MKVARGSFILYLEWLKCEMKPRNKIIFIVSYLTTSFYYPIFE